MALNELKGASTFAEFASALVRVDPSALSGGEVNTLARVIDALPGDASVRTALLGNFTLDQLPDHAKVCAAASGIRVETYVAPFGQYFQEVLSYPDAGGLGAFDPDVIVLFLSLPDLEPESMRDFPALGDGDRAALRERVVEHVGGWIRAARERTRATLLIANFPRAGHVAAGVADTALAYGETEFHAELNLDLLRLVKSEEKAYLFDLDRLVADVGVRNATDARLYYLAKMRWSDPMLARIGDELCRHLRAQLGRSKKCLVLDLDNTLWGGVVGEEGAGGVRVGSGDPVGEAFRDFQTRIKAIKERGILLALCSKNNPEDALEVFRTRSMPLEESDFAAMEISWSPKHEGIQAIARKLSIGTDSLVFVDDNPAEVELVRQLLPEVRSYLLPEDPAALPAFAESWTDFEKANILGEDRAKTQRYREEGERQAVRQDAGSLESYLESLETRVDLRDATTEDRERVHQLFTKTNQFNLTTIRHGRDRIEKFLAGGRWRLRLLEARDRFGDLGIVGLALLEVGDDALAIDSLLMSCRALGRGIEIALMNDLKACSSLIAPSGLLRARFCPTAKNKPAESYLESQGFVLRSESEDGERAYELQIADAEPRPCAWLRVETR
ncbi:MAG: HAD-IIIC family phosphatase [Planctomycetota bacterium]|jgi:FkbH-like protein